MEQPYFIVSELSDGLVHMKEVYPPREEIERAIQGWWSYFERKVKASPEDFNGIYPKVFDDSQNSTIKLSLVPNVAPELHGLGRLVNAKRPHVYVEGTKNPDIIVPYEELPPQNQDSISLYISNFFGYTEIHNIQPGEFLLYVFSSNDLDTSGRFYSKGTVKELFFFRSDGDISAYSLEGKLISIHLNPLRRFYRLPPKVRSALSFYTNRGPTIMPVLSDDIEIVRESFEEALSEIKE